MYPRFLGALLIGALFVPFSASAQSLGSTEVLDVALSPKYPKPGEVVLVSVKSYAVDLASGTVVVSVDGTEVERGTGFITTQVRIGAAGKATTISVVATVGGQTYRKQLTVRPADVALLIEPLTTVHPFYKGGALVGSEALLRVVALPDIRNSAGVRVASSNLIYTWRKGSQILQENSGLGRSTLTATAPARFRTANISVTVTTQDQSVVAYAETSVSPTDPLIRIYEHDPLLGPLFERAFSNVITMQGDEETFRMVPYFFSSSPSTSWLLNSVATGASRDITVRSTGGGSGSALLSANAKGAGLFQNAEASLSVRFGEANPLGIFGL